MNINILDVIKSVVLPKRLADTVREFDHYGAGEIFEEIYRHPKLVCQEDLLYYLRTLDENRAQGGSLMPTELAERVFKPDAIAEAQRILTRNLGLTDLVTKFTTNNSTLIERTGNRSSFSTKTFIKVLFKKNMKYPITGKQLRNSENNYFTFDHKEHMRKPKVLIYASNLYQGELIKTILLISGIKYAKCLIQVPTIMIKKALSKLMDFGQKIAIMNILYEDEVDPDFYQEIDREIKTFVEQIYHIKEDNVFLIVNYNNNNHQHRQVQFPVDFILEE